MSVCVHITIYYEFYDKMKKEFIRNKSFFDINYTNIEVFLYLSITFLIGC